MRQMFRLSFDFIRLQKFYLMSGTNIAISITHVSAAFTFVPHLSEEAYSFITHLQSINIISLL